MGRPPRQTRQHNLIPNCIKFTKPFLLPPSPSKLSHARALAILHPCSPSSPLVPSLTVATETQSASSVGVSSSAPSCKVENVAEKLRRRRQREREAAATQGDLDMVEQLSPPPRSDPRNLPSKRRCELRCPTLLGQRRIQRHAEPLRRAFRRRRCRRSTYVTRPTRSGVDEHGQRLRPGYPQHVRRNDRTRVRALSLLLFDQIFA